MPDMMDVLFATPSTRPRVERPKTRAVTPPPPPPIPPLPYKPRDESDDTDKTCSPRQHYIPPRDVAKAQESRPDFADDIDAMVARFVVEGWLYLDVKADEYRARQRRWREMTEEEKSWNAQP